MSVASIAASFVASQAAQTQTALGAAMLKMNAEAGASIVAVLEAAQDNLDKLANVAPGIGANVDISA